MGLKSQYQVAVVNEINLANTAVVIPAGQTESNILNCGGTCPTGIFLNGDFTAANISFAVGKTVDSVFYEVRNFDGSLFTIAGQPGLYIPLMPSMFNSVLYLQVIVDTVQIQNVTIDFSLAPVFQGIHN